MILGQIEQLRDARWLSASHPGLSHRRVSGLASDSVSGRRQAGAQCLIAAGQQASQIGRLAGFGL